MVGVKWEMRSRKARRGSAAAIAATFLALTSHILGGGSMPTFLGLAVPLALPTLVCVLLAGRRLSLTRLSASVFVSQGLFHGLFTVFTPMHTMGPTSAADRQAMLHSGMQHSSGTASGTAMSGGAGMGSMPGMDDPSAMLHAHASPQMTTMHIIAAFVTIALIYWAEALPTKLAEFVRLVLGSIVPALCRLRALPTRPRAVVALTVLLPQSLGTIRSPILRRGPPHLAF